MKITPLKDQVIVKRREEEKMSATGLLHIPGNAQEKSIQGEVLAVGSGRVLENGMVLAPAVKAGDRVLFQKHAFIEIKIDGEEYLILREDSILAVLENE